MLMKELHPPTGLNHLSYLIMGEDYRNKYGLK